MSYKSFLQRNFGMFFFVTLGLIAGFLYYKYVGCVSGTSAITANPIMSVLYGGILGGLFHSIITEIFIPMSKRNIWTNKKSDSFRGIFIRKQRKLKSL